MAAVVWTLPSIVIAGAGDVPPLRFVAPVGFDDVDCE